MSPGTVEMNLVTLCAMFTVIANVVCSPDTGTVPPQTGDLFPGEVVFEKHVVYPEGSSSDEQGIVIDILSEFQGEVKWKETSNTSLELAFTAYQQNKVISGARKIDLQTSLEDGRLEVRIKPLESIPLVTESLQVNRAESVNANIPFLLVSLTSFMTLSITCLIAPQVSLDHRLSLLVWIVGYLAFVTCVDSGLWQDDLRCDIFIYYPRNTTFSNISISVPNGRITIPPKETFINFTNVQTSCSTNVTSQGCSFCCHGNGFCGPGDICVCTGNYNHETDCETLIQPKYKLYTNKIDSRLASFDSLDGFTHLSLGKRRNNGVTRTMTEIRSRDTNGNEVVIALKKGKTIKEIFTTEKDGKRIQFINSCNIRITSATKQENGKYEMLMLNRCRQKGKNSKKLNKLFRREYLNSMSYEKAIQDIQDKDFLLPDYKYIGTDKQYSIHNETFIKIPVVAKRCGETDLTSVVYASVFVKQSENDILSVLNIKGKARSYPGSFYIKLPIKTVSSKDHIKPLRMCNQFRKAAVKLCTRNKRILSSNVAESCARVFGISTQQVQNTSHGLNESVVQTCNRGFTALKSYCDNAKTIKTSNECLDSFTEREQLLVNNETSVIFTVIFRDGHSVRSPVYKFTNTFAHVTETVVLESKKVIPKITNFGINPPDPLPNQGYEATIGYTCVTDTTEMRMRVEGDDSYSSDVTCRGVQKCNCCTLHVAGATEHVTDTVKINLSDVSSGVNITREYRVMF